MTSCLSCDIIKKVTMTTSTSASIENLNTIGFYVSDFIDDMGQEFTLDQASNWFDGIYEHEDLIDQIKEACLLPYERHQIAHHISYSKI